MAFEIGQRVRCVEAVGGIEVGNTYVVSSVEGGFVQVDGRDADYWPQRFVLANEEPVAPQAPRAYRVGDRVRFTIACPVGWGFGPHRPEEDRHQGVIERVNEGQGGYKYRVGYGIRGYNGGVNDEHIELIQAALPVNNDDIHIAGNGWIDQLRINNPFPAAPQVPPVALRDRYTLFVILAGQRDAPQRFNYVARRDADNRLEALRQARVPILATKELSFSY